jgi:hypothetical protein
MRKPSTVVIVILVCLAALGLGTVSVAQVQGLIFADGFESGDTSAWFRTREQTPGALDVNTAAAMAGSTYGLEVAADGIAWVETREPDRERDLKVSFFFNPDNIELIPGARIDILRFYGKGRRHHLRLVLRGAGPGLFRLALLVRGNSGRYQEIGSGLVVAGAENLIEVDWRAASTRNGTNGSAALWINGELEANEPSIANGRLDVRSVRLGSVALASTQNPEFVPDVAGFFDEITIFRLEAP